MRVYLAAPYAARDALRPLADELPIIGMEVTSRWLTEDHLINDGTTGAATAVDNSAVRQHCRNDFADINKAHVLVVFTGVTIGALLGGVQPNGSLHSGGRHVETGFALARNKPVIVVGQPENIFHRGVCTVVPDWHAAVLQLCAIARNRPMDVEAAS